nr:TRIC cation channel family protein [uncultured Lachnoclostridium sp.]
MNTITMNVLSSIEILGTIAFAISGAMVAVRKQVDLFGVILLGMTTAVGGGMTRDVMLGYTPPRIFEALPMLAIAFVSSLIVFLLAFFSHDIYQKNQQTVDRINNIFDALGLGLFTVTGMDVAAGTGIQDMVILVFFGVVTGTGGGLIRDLMVSEIPFVLKKHIYAVASIAGGIAYYIMGKCKVSVNLAVVITIIIVVLLRMLATKYRWNLPKVKTDL